MPSISTLLTIARSVFDTLEVFLDEEISRPQDDQCAEQIHEAIRLLWLYIKRFDYSDEIREAIAYACKDITLDELVDVLDHFDLCPLFNLPMLFMTTSSEAVCQWILKHDNDYWQACWDLIDDKLLGNLDKSDMDWIKIKMLYRSGHDEDADHCPDPDTEEGMRSILDDIEEVIALRYK
jgi:hypothetical protein